MPIKFDPNFSITPKIAACLMRIEAAKQRVSYLPITPTVLATLRETARLFTTHYSTMIEGNRLAADEIKKVLQHEGHFPGRERDEQEVKGYYGALHQVEQWSASKIVLAEKHIQKIHALIMRQGGAKFSSYRDGQNVIRDARTKLIVYMPPEAKDVPELMAGFIQWFQENSELPCPILAGIAHYQFATIHPYYDGNGRTARLLTTLILHLGGYDLKGLYSLEEYYARNLEGYYQAISIGPSHNYYLGRAEADITPWLEYFIEGMAQAFENVINRMSEAYSLGSKDQELLLKKLDPRQRKSLELFQTFEHVATNQIGELFGFKPRTASALCKQWVEEGFIEIAIFPNKIRKYRLSNLYKNCLS